MSRIPQDFIEELLSRIDIVEVIEERWPLKKAGREFTACCPFHSEKTPSFTVSKTKQFYHCFGCGAHGTAIGFLMAFARLDFGEAVAELAHQVGMPLPSTPEKGGQEAGVAELYGVLQQAKDFYCQQLERSHAAVRARHYIAQRGLSKEVIQAFEVGFAPPGWRNLAAAMGGGEVLQDRLLRSGLTVSRPGAGPYDRFRDRITFPIHDRRGRIVGFGGRVLDQSTPKYLNSPETVLFRKRRELYGLFQALQHRNGIERVIVVEGYLDVLTLRQFGMANVVATLGTAIGLEQLERLFGTVPEVIMCLDGDQAGRTAAWRALEIALPAMRDGRRMSFMFLPEGEDPDSLVRREGRAAFEARVARAKGLTTYLFEHLLQQAGNGTLEARARLVALAKPLLRKLPVGALQRLALQHLAELSGVAASELSRRPARPKPLGRPGNPWPGDPHRASPSLVHKTVLLLLQCPALAGQAAQAGFLDKIELPGIALLKDVVEFLTDRPKISMGAIVERFREHPAGAELATLATQECHLLDDGIEREFTDALHRLWEKHLEQRYESLTVKCRTSALDETEKCEYRSLLQRRGGAKTQDRAL
ncbi:MAG: DNA primase [Gammaproteobacteria bacterium]